MTTDVTNRNRNRNPKGISTGGQFAAEARSEAAGVTLTARPRFMDPPMLSEGGKSPWGEIQSVERDADGIEFATTDGHGGFKLSPERNKQVPAPLRNGNGWYEEDCERHIVEATFADEMGRTEEQRAYSTERIKNWYPDEYTKVTGEPVALEESRVLQDRAERANERAWREQHREQFIAESAYNSGSDFDLEGYSQIKARRASDGAERTYVMPLDKRHNRTPYLLEDRAGEPVDITDIIEQSQAARAKVTGDEIGRDPGAPVTDLGVDYASLTEAKRTAVAKDLGKRWRFTRPDGTSYATSLGEHLETYGTTGKSQHIYEDNTRRSYAVNTGDDRHVQVSKTTFDAMTGVPDLTTEYGHLHHDRAIEMNRAARARSAEPDYGNFIEDRKNARAKEAAHMAKAEELWEQMRPIAETARAERRAIIEDTTAKVRARLGLNG
ncbi:hypothetical protein LG293_17025 (plasmid) [Citricoccus nitrophenolicus]